VVHNIILHSLLDGQQGKLTTTAHPHGVAGLCTELVDWEEDDKDLEREDNADSSNTTRSADTVCKDTNPINHGKQIQPREKFPAINSVRLQLSETTPTPKGAATPFGDSMLVNKGNTTVNTPKGTPTPLGEPLPVNVRIATVNAQANKTPNDVHSRGHDSKEQVNTFL
jgi:hypothetical protein